jgi:hypothetical protein
MLMNFVISEDRDYDLFFKTLSITWSLQPLSYLRRNQLVGEQRSLAV